MLLKPTLNDFLTIENFLNLQLRFINNDERQGGYLESYDFSNKSELERLLKMNDFYIVYKRGDYETAVYEDVYFYKDYIQKSISQIGLNEINTLKSDLNKQFKYDLPVRKEYLRSRSKEIKEFIRNLEDCKYIQEIIKKSLKEECDEILEFIHDDKIWEESNPIENKVKIKFTKAEIATLFLLLRQRDLIDQKYDSELGKILDNNFMYFNYTEQSYREITNSKKLLNDLKNGNKPIETSIDSLKKLFSDPDFFEFNN